VNSSATDDPSGASGSTTLARLAEQWTTRGLDGPSETELLVPPDLTAGSPEHLRFVTLVRGISGLYREVELWRRGGELHADVATHWVFDTGRVAFEDWRALEAALGRHGLAERRQDVRGWYDVARGLQGRFKGDVAAMVVAAGPAAADLVEYVAANKATFPLLAGDRIAARWADQLRRVARVAVDDAAPGLTERLGSSVRDRLARAGVELDSDEVPVHHALAATAWADLPTTSRASTLADL